MLPLVLVTLLLGAAAVQERLPTSAPFRNAKLAKRNGSGVVLAGKRFEVHMHFDDLWAAKSALEAVETVWPVAMEFLDAAGTEPPYPLEMHLYPTQRDYAEIEAILTDGWFKNTGSFAHWTSKTAHVAMAPPLADRAARRIVLTAQTREVLLHEAAHLATYTVIPTYRWHPTWFSEGLAMCIEQEAARRLELLHATGDHPRYSTDQVLLQRLVERDALPGLGSLLRDSLEELRFHERYALQLEFFSLIVEDHPTTYRAMIEEAKRLRGGGAFRQGLAEFMVRSFDAEELSRELRERIDSLSPAWYLDYRAFDIHGDEWTQAAFPETPAVAWRTAPVGAAAYSLSGELELLGEEMSVLLDHTDLSHVAVSLRADGNIVASHQGADGSRELVRAVSEELAAGAEHSFRIDVQGSRVSVWVDERKRLEFDAGPEDLAGPWGLGVPPGGAGVWRGVELVR